MSPYEALLLAEPTRHIGLWAKLPPEAVAPFSALAASPPKLGGLADMRVFVRVLPRGAVAFAYLTVPVDDLGIPAALSAAPWWKALAGQTAGGWRRMEFINLSAHQRNFPHRAGATVQRLGLVAGLRPASEALYRSLHQTNWPGIVERMVRSNYRAWTTFLTDDGADLLLFTTVEYSGSDLAADNAAIAADPVTRRWWSHTEPCLIPQLPGGPNWTGMERVA